ncbi:DNA-binding protein [Paenibacillus swuensis]|uniref:DNA-binding protein n=2 Tax=Paenibacillus swuensis TaxID=1178515 RepID=A0A172TNR8_9BACL|nr:DNA-binding protein [Paenibacillus swuensis]
MQHHLGTGFVKPGQVIVLRKEPDNAFDQEAIKAEVTALGQIGYVANSPHTVPKGCKSAGRIYDTFEEHLSGVVRFVLKDTAIVECQR